MLRRETLESVGPFVTCHGIGFSFEEDFSSKAWIVRFSKGMKYMQVRCVDYNQLIEAMGKAIKELKVEDETKPVPDYYTGGAITWSDKIPPTSSPPPIMEPSWPKIDEEALKKAMSKYASSIKSSSIRKSGPISVEKARTSAGKFYSSYDEYKEFDALIKAKEEREEYEEEKLHESPTTVAARKLLPNYGKY